MTHSKPPDEIVDEHDDLLRRLFGRLRTRAVEVSSSFHSDVARRAVEHEASTRPSTVGMLVEFVVQATNVATDLFGVVIGRHESPKPPASESPSRPPSSR